MEWIKTQGILLKETPLANDDVILEIFTLDLGRVSVFVSKLQRSKKKRSEIDFFRLMALEIEAKNHSYKLKNVHTKKVFHVFGQNYELINQGFSFLQRLQKVLPEAKPLESFFILVCHVFETLNLENKEVYWAYLRIQLLIFSGIMPRFDIVRESTFFDPSHMAFTSQENENFCHLTNESRQVIEFLRRLQFSELFFEYKKVLDKDFSEVNSLLQRVEEFH